MATRSDQDDMDDDFNEIYKAYTGPTGSSSAAHPTSASAASNSNKRSRVGDSDEEEEVRDPNAVPTDFTSREAKVWEAKSKATERNWKKRKEEEMICKICGDSGHFTQGCPSTLGGSRKSMDFFERVAARDSSVRALFTERVIQKIEKDIGCKIKMDEKFIIVSGKDRLVLKKGVDAVHQVIKGEGDNHKDSSASQKSRSRSPVRSPIGSRYSRSNSQGFHASQPRDKPQYKGSFGKQDRAVDGRLREEMQKFSKGSPQAYGNDGARGRSSLSRSPAHPAYPSKHYSSYDVHDHGHYGIGDYRMDGWDTETRSSDSQSGQFGYSGSPQTLEELELEYKKEATELVRIRDKEEDDENYRHRESIMEMRENYMNKLAVLRTAQSRQWEEFLQFDALRHQQAARLQGTAPSFGSYKQHTFSEYDGSPANPHYAGGGLTMDSRARYLNHMESYPSRPPHDTYGDFQRHRREDFGKAYNRY